MAISVRLLVVATLAVGLAVAVLGQQSAKLPGLKLVGQPSPWTATLPLAYSNVTTAAGDGTNAHLDGTGTSAELYEPSGFAITGGYGYFMEPGYMRRINLSTDVVSTVSGNGTYGCSDGTTPANSEYGHPDAMTTDGSSLYWLDSSCYTGGNAVLRQMPLSTDVATTVPIAGGFFQTGGLTIGPSGVMYTAGDDKVYSIDLSTDTRTLVATLPTVTYGSQSLVQNTISMTADGSDLWISTKLDAGSFGYGPALTEVDPSTGTATTVIHQEVLPLGTASVGGNVVSAGDYLYVQSGNDDITRVDKSTGVATVGIGVYGGGPFADGSGTTATFYGPYGGIDTDGTHLWVDDAGYNRIREISAAPPPSVLPSGSTASYSSSAISGPELPVGCNASEHCDCSTGQATKNPVNTNTGAFWHSFTDLSTPGHGPALDVTRTYVSLLASQSGLFGYGWSWSYGAFLTQDSSSGGDVTVHQEDGSTVAYAPTIGTAMTPLQPRMLATLTHNLDGTYTLRRADQSILTFNSGGQLTSISDVNGYATTLTYTSGVLTAITDAEGRTYTVTVTSGHITAMADAESHTYTYAYNGSGELTSVTDPTGAVTAFSYDSSHQMLTMLDPDQHGAGSPTPLTNTYDGSGRVTSQVDWAGRTTSFDYTSISGATKVTDPVGNVTVDYYTNGLRTKTTAGYGTGAAADTTFTYDPTTEAIASVTDPLGHVTSYTYDSSGNQVTSTDPLSHVTTTTYNSLNEPLTVTDPASVVTTYTYDSNGNILTTSTPLIVGGVTTATRTVTYTRGDGTHPDDVTSVTDPNGNVTTYTYDTYGDKVSMTAPATPENSSGNKTTYAYDTTTGWLTSTVAPKGNLSGATAANYTTTYGHDADGRVTYTRDSMWSSGSPTLHEVTTVYDANGNVTSDTDADGNTTSYAYDKDDELVTTTQPDSTTLTQTWTADGMLHTSTDAASHTTTDTYDARNDLATTQRPGGETTTYTYDLAGRVTLQADPGATCTGTPTSGCTSFTYNNGNELTAKSYLDGVTHNVTSITYDADGRQTAETDATGTSSSTYDTLGRLTSSTDGHGTTTSYTYDLNGNTLTTTYPGSSHTVTDTYDALNRLATVTDWNSHTTSYAYDADSNPVTTTLPSGTSEADTNTYNQLDQLTAISDTKSSTTLAGFSYTRDSAGQVLTSTTTGISEPNQTYTYNSLQQLTASGSSSTPTSYAYTAGNDISNRGTTSGGTGSTLTYNADDQPCWSATTTVSSPTCTTVPSGSTTYTYNADGERTSSTGPGSSGGSSGSSGSPASPPTEDAEISADSTSSSGVVTTSSFTTTTPGDLLVALVSSSGPESQSGQTDTVTGAGLTWSLVTRENGQAGDVEVWQARASGTLSSVTITATEATPGTYYSQMLTVMAFAGAAGVGASNGASGAEDSGAPTVSLTTTVANSLVLGVGNDWESATTRTIGSSESMLHEFSDTSTGQDFWAEELTDPVGTAGTFAMLADPAPTNDRYDFAAVEIVPTDTDTSTLAVDAQTSADRTDTSGSITSNPFSTTTEGDLLVAMVSNDGPESQDSQSDTVTGAGLTWSLVTRSNGQAGDAEVWQARASGVLSAVTVTATEATSGYAQMLTVTAFRGAGGIGASNSTSGAEDSGAATVSLTTTVGGSLVYGVGEDWELFLPHTVDTGQRMIHELSNTFDYEDYWAQQLSDPVSTAGTVATLDDTAPTDDRYDFAAVEIIPATAPAVTALALDAQTSADRTDTSGSITSNPFSTTTAGDLIIAMVSSSGPNGAASQSTTVTGAGLTWSLVTRADGQSGVAEIWQATTSGILSAVTVTATEATTGYPQMLTILAFRGSGGVGASNSSSGAHGGGAPTVSLTTTANNSLVYGVGNDWDLRTPRTVDTGQRMVHELSDTIYYEDFWAQQLTSPVSTSGTVATLDDTAPTGDRYDFAAVEITPASLLPRH